jgi:apolipoprotein N-acyltransferase
MRGFALKFIVLWGWRRLLVAMLAGIVCTTAAPPLYILPGQIIGLCVLVWLLDGVCSQVNDMKQAIWPAFFTGWSFGFGYFFLGLHWIDEAFLVEPEVFGWMIPFVVILFPLGLGLFYGLAVVLALPLWAPGFARIFVLASAFTAAEWVRGNVFTGFPWNALGYSAGVLDGWLQLAAFGGLYGLTFLMVFLSCAPAVLADETGKFSTHRLGGLPGLVVAGCIGTAAWGVGAYRLTNAPLQFHDDVNLRIVQPNIAQKEKWKPANKEKFFDLFLSLSDKATSPERNGVDDITHLIWPESAVPFFLEETPRALSAIAKLLPENVTLLTGGLRRPETPSENDDPAAVFNSVLMINGNGAVFERYDKFHLVPFGEYLPLAGFFEWFGLRKLVAAPGGFLRGEGLRTLPVPGAPAVSPLICYEAIFPGEVWAAEKRPGWLLNVTNDAWFGTSFGPKQHFAQVRMRAIEEGLPLVRAANTGISAVIGPNGRIIKMLPLGVQGVLDARLPQAAAPTLFSSMRNLACMFVILMGILLSVAFGRKRKRVGA